MRVVSLARTIGVDRGPGEGGVATGGSKTPVATPPHARLAADTRVLGPERIGVKADRLEAALRAGLPVLPGWVVPVGEGESARGAGVDAIRAHGVAAGRMAVLGVALDA